MKDSLAKFHLKSEFTRRGTEQQMKTRNAQMISAMMCARRCACTTMLGLPISVGGDPSSNLSLTRRSKCFQLFLYEFIFAEGSANNIILRKIPSSIVDDDNRVTNCSVDDTGSVMESGFGAMLSADNIAEKRAL